MKNRFLVWFVLFCSFLTASQLFGIEKNNKATVKIFNPSNEKFNYIGRFDFSNPAVPKVWAAGAYITANFEGSVCEVYINDEIRYGEKHNYIYIVIDDTLQLRQRLEEKENKITFSKSLSNTKHKLTICKDTEAQIGYIEFIGLGCEKLLEPDQKPSLKFEFIGNSITSGTGVYTDEIKCGERNWSDQHDAYNTYGARLARRLNAQYHLSSKSGIGIIHSCCDIKFTMPEIYTSYNFEPDGDIYNVAEYQPDLISICLGQNDGIQDSTIFCSKYVEFVEQLTEYYADVKIICITSPMGDVALNSTLQSYITGIIADLESKGINNIYSYSFKQSYNSGCDAHPNKEEHKLIADELEPVIIKILDKK